MSQARASVQGHHILSYSVDHGKHEIRLKTEKRESDLGVRTEVVFRGVIAYQFIHDGFENILFDIEETSPDEILEMNWELFESEKEFGWPGPWAATPESAHAHFAKSAIHGWILVASMGLNGWILGKSMDIEASLPSEALFDVATISYEDLAPTVHALMRYANSGDDDTETQGRTAFGRLLKTGLKIVFIPGEDEHPDAIRLFDGENLVAWAAFFDGEVVALENAKALEEAANLIAN